MATQIKHIIRNCKAATQLALQKEERKLTLKEELKLKLHLVFCDACKQFIQQSVIINKAMQQAKDAFMKHPTQQLSDASKAKIQQQLNDLP
jgi:hypothetical protein